MKTMMNLVGMKWCELTNELQNELLIRATVVDAETCNTPKQSGECIIDLTDNASVVGYYHVTDEEDYITVSDDAVIYSPID